MSGQREFFGIDERYVTSSAVVDFEMFRPVLDVALARSIRRRVGGRLATRC
jgi:hypothetical protein